MENPSANPVPPTRNFTPISVGQCHVQTATDRFGNGANKAVRDRELLVLNVSPLDDEQPFLWPNPATQHEDNDSGVPERNKSIYHLVPSMQANRNNLTALSQSSNLYFVAYLCDIFVYKLRSGAEHTLPRQPDLQLKPPPSDQARAVGGYIDQSRGHVINHIITGFLGHDEIILACYDDGDVVAYYVKDATDYIRCRKSNKGKVARVQSMEERSAPYPRLFFHENVGKSAWGLAIHQNSRLIAVTSNRREITVFAFALSSDPSGRLLTPEKAETPKRVEDRVRQRHCNWRIVIFLGHQADNLPNVCFLDNVDGFAEKVCAIDIKGSTWIAHIWRANQPASRVAPFDMEEIVSDEFYPEVSRGWGILGIHTNAFMKVKTVEELTGLPLDRCNVRPSRSWGHPPTARIDPCLEDVPDNPCPPSRARLADARRRAQAQPFGQLFDNNEATFLIGIEDFEDDMSDDGMLLGDDDDQFVFDNEQEEGDDEEMADDDDENDDNDAYGSGEVIMLAEDGGQAEPTANQEQVQGGTEASPAAENGNSSPLQITTLTQFLQQDIPSTLGPTLHGLGAAFTQIEGAFEELEGALAGTLAGPQPILPLTLPTFSVSLQLPEFGNATFNFNPSSLMTASPLLPKEEGVHGEGEDEPQESAPASEDRRLSMIYYPHNGEVRPEPTTKASRLAFVTRNKAGCNKRRAFHKQALDRLAPGYRIIRSYEKDFEMFQIPGEPDWSGHPAEIGMLCRNAVDFERFRDRNASLNFRATSRLNFLAHIPELCLVALGSPTGRVILATLTELGSRTKGPTGTGNWYHGIRVEWVLPREKEETRYRTVKRPLHGMALGRISDVEESGNKEWDGKRDLLPKRYRLMLHYRTHDIFSYEITRNEQTGKICLF